MSSKNRSLIYLSFIALLALYLRLRYVIYTPFQFKIDAWSMYHYAMNVAKGRYYGHCFGEHWARYAYWPPLYIFLSGFVYRFLGTAQDFLAMRLIQSLFSAGSCLLCYGIAGSCLEKYNRFHREAGLTAGVLMALNPRMVVYTNHLYSETVFIFIYLAAIYFSLRYFQATFLTKTRQHNAYMPVKPLVLYSLLLGFGCLTRPVLLLLPLVMLVFLLLHVLTSGRRPFEIFAVVLRDTALTYLIMLAVFTPWIIRNYAVTGRFILIDTNGPINFYIAHNPIANGTWVDVKPHTDINRLYETGYREGLVHISGHIPHELSLMRLKQKLFLYAADPHISEATVYLDRAYKLPLYGSLIRMGLIDRDTLESFYKLPRMSFSFLWMSFIALLAVFLIRLAAARSFHILFCEPSWIIGNLLYSNLIIQIFYFAPRYRITSEPFLCAGIGIFIAVALSRLHPTAGSC